MVWIASTSPAGHERVVSSAKNVFKIRKWLISAPKQNEFSCANAPETHWICSTTHKHWWAKEFVGRASPAGHEWVISVTKAHYCIVNSPATVGTVEAANLHKDECKCKRACLDMFYNAWRIIDHGLDSQRIPGWSRTGRVKCQKCVKNTKIAHFRTETKWILMCKCSRNALDMLYDA